MKRQSESPDYKTFSLEFPDEIAAIGFAEKLARETGQEIIVRDAEGIKLCIAPIKLSS
jgi:hypothetical protein